MYTSVVSISLFLVIATLPISSLAQKQVDTTRQVAFVYFKNRNTNFILIPNVDKLHTFRFYRKANADTAYAYVTEKIKPALPLKRNFPTYGVSWEDTENSGKNVEYMIIAVDKNGKDICKLKIIWEDAYQKE